jgi:prepilin-type processing-associated H-X9-DG protein
LPKNSPGTYIFKTREGGLGILQILEVKYVKYTKIRYKMVQPGVGEPVLKLQVVQPKREWWRIEPTVTKSIYEGDDLEIEWDVHVEGEKRIKNFTVGVLPIEEDISDLNAHYYWEDNLAFTVRRTPYGKEWKVRQRSGSVSPKTLRPGEYRVCVCAFSQYRHGVGWSDRLTGVIGAGTAKLIVKPRPFTGAAAVDVAKRQVFLPDADTPGVGVVLDLASGELLPAGAGKQQLTVFRELGKGDLAYDRVLICLRGGKARLLQEGRLANLEIFGQMEDSTAYKLPTTPCRLVVTTAEGNAYEVKVLSVEGDKTGVHIEYWKSAGALAGFTGAVAVLHADPAVKLSRLGQAVAVYAADNNGKMPATLKELKPYLGGDDFKWLIENVRYFGKGQESQEPDTPIAYDNTLLEKGNGTNVLFLDGHVGFLTPEELKRPVKFLKGR